MGGTDSQEKIYHCICRAPFMKCWLMVLVHCSQSMNLFYKPLQVDDSEMSQTYFVCKASLASIVTLWILNIEQCENFPDNCTPGVQKKVQYLL